MEIALELNNISKQFGATRALDSVDLTVRHGEVHAVVGENGSGKSTLIKVLAGVHEPEPGGSLVIDGQPAPLPMPSGAFHDFGLSFVHQDLGLARPLTVLENLVGAAAREDYSRFRVNWRAEATEARRMLESYGVTIDPRTIVNELPRSDRRSSPSLGPPRSCVTTASAPVRSRRCSCSTSRRCSCPEGELEFLFNLIREVVASGSSVIFISHDLAAVRTIADRVTVLRDGKVAASASMAEVTDEQIVEFIVGPVKSRELREHGGQFHVERVVDRSGPPRLVVSGLRGGRLRSLDLEVARGEVVGIAGLLGSGAEEVPYLLFGAHRAEAGRVTIRGRQVDITRQQPASAVGMGFSFIPADRNRDGIAREIEIDRNMMLLVLRRFRRGGRLRNRAVRSTAGERAEQFDLRPRRTDLHSGTLSGGNAQKVVLAKWLETDPDVLLLHEPTQGVDIAARAQIYRTIIAAARRGHVGGVGVERLRGAREHLRPHRRAQQRP